MASGSQNMTTWEAKRVIGSNNAANPSGALLESGTGRANSAAGDTWIFLDSLGGTSSPYGIKHDQADNLIVFIGDGTVRTKIFLGESKVEATTFAGNANTASKWQTARTLTIGGTGKDVDGSGNVSWSMNEIMGSSDSSKFYCGDKTWSDTLIGPFNVLTQTSVDKAFSICRGSTSEATKIWVDDSYTHFYVENDETTANIEFRLHATDTESGGGANANTSYVYFLGQNNKSTIQADIFNKGYGSLYLNSKISTRPSGAAITQPSTDVNPVELVSFAASGADFGIIHISNDGSYICNSADMGWAFAVFDTDKTVDFSTAANASFYVKQNQEGAVFKGTVTAGLMNAPAYTLNDATSAGTNYITGSAGRIYFGGNFHIDSLGSNATYINYYTANNILLCSGSAQGLVGIGKGPGESMKLDVSGPIRCYATTTNNRVPMSSGLTGVAGYGSAGQYGTIIYSNGISMRDPYTGSGNDCGFIRHIETTSNSGYLEIGVGDDGTEQVYVRQYNTSSSVVRTLTLLDENGNTSVPKTLILTNDIFALNFRNNDSYRTGFSYQTYGNEALLLAMRQSVTSFIVANGVDPNSASSSQWTGVTPALQCKSGSVRIGGLWGHGVTPDYKLRVDGNSCFNGDTYFANSTTYYINKFARAYLEDIRGGKIRLCGRDITFYSEADAKGTSYGSIQCDSTSMYFRKSSDQGTYAYTFVGGNIDTNGYGLHAKHGHDFLVAGNEFNFIPDAYSGSIWFNYETYNRKNNGAITEYIFGDGKHTALMNFKNNEITFSGSGCALKCNGTFQFLTINGGAQNGMFYGIGCGPNYNSFDLTNYRLYVNGAAYISASMRVAGQMRADGYSNYYITENNRSAFFHWNADPGQQWWYLMFTAAGDPYGTFTSLRALYVNADTGYSYHTRAYGAVWNDYAEFRAGETEEPGRVVMEQENGIMCLCNERLALGTKIISDTYGFAIGETKECKTPIAVSGRVLVYPYRERHEYPLGAAVCSAPGGTVDLMTREEIMMYPERIMGTVSEIPEYETWACSGSVELGPSDKIQVNGRIWIYVK